MIVRKSLALMLVMLSLLNVGIAMAGEPLSADSRIRTFVYSENEVFRLVTRFGYQSNIELGKEEEILTLSVGDASAFKITPSTGRIFVKAMRNDSITNMTLVTNKRAYQFELSSVVESNRDIIYVMRFFYPSAPGDDEYGSKNISPQEIKKRIMASRVPSASKGSGDAQRYSFDIAQSSADMQIKSVLNTQYSKSGDMTIAPERVFDDGRSTFFKFADSIAYVPSFYTVLENGNERSIPARKEGLYVVVSGIYPKLALRSGPSVICIFNDKISPRKLAAG